MNKIIISAVFISFIVPTLAFANPAPEDGTYCGKTILKGEDLPNCGNGPIMVETSWIVCQSSGNYLTGVGYTRTNCKVANTLTEKYRLETLEIARQILDKPIRSNWKNTIVQSWLDRYLAGER